MYIYICLDIVKAGWSSRTFRFVPEQTGKTSVPRVR